MEEKEEGCGSLVRGEALWGSLTLCPAKKRFPSHSLLSFSFTIKGNGTEPDWGWGLGWAIALELSGVMEASCFAVEGGQGSGDASASLSQRKLQERLWGRNRWGRDQLAACVHRELGRASTGWPSLSWDHQKFVLHAPASLI